MVVIRVSKKRLRRFIVRVVSGWAVLATARRSSGGSVVIVVDV